MPATVLPMPDRTPREKPCIHKTLAHLRGCSFFLSDRAAVDFRLFGSHQALRRRPRGGAPTAETYAPFCFGVYRRSASVVQRTKTHASISLIIYRFSHGRGRHRSANQIFRTD